MRRPPGAPSCEAKGAQGSNTLVVYFSRSGNTRVVAGLIQRALAADLFEIKPATPYPEEYLATVEQAGPEERDRGSRSRRLAAMVPDLARYDTVYLGFPIWGETAPSLMRSFLCGHMTSSNKTLVPFITHGGYGCGKKSGRARQPCAEGATAASSFSMQADQERQTMNTVNGWLHETGGVMS